VFRVRPYTASDLEALYTICLETGDSGANATNLYNDPKLLGHFYAAPYGVLEPELALMLEDAAGVCGYIIGTKDSGGFQARMNAWLEPLREHYALPEASNTTRDAAMIRVIHRGYEFDSKLEPEYPAHLHIDLLPRAQGQGQGKRLMQTFLEKLRQLEVPGVHLGVGSKNTNAIAFYEHMGFTCLEQFKTWSLYGKRITTV
jgi:ribosomal protein S18 acetylase RimI-like enzyme